MMFNSLLKIPSKNYVLFTRDRKWNLTHLQLLHKSTSKTLKREVEPITISYLVNSCGLSSQAALSASKAISIRTTENPDRVLETLKSYGFSSAHIAKLIGKLPRLLLSNLDDNIKPKLDYFISMGYSGGDLGTLLSTNPALLKSSLEKRVKPNFELLRSIFATDQQVAAAVRRSCRLLQNNLHATFLPNVQTLQSYGVPLLNIAKLVSLNPRVILYTNEQLKMAVESTVRMGFDPLSTMFVRGVYVIAAVSPSIWANKVAAFKSFGWSDAEVVSAFIKHPFCMMLSTERIRQSLEFYTEKMKWKPSFIAACPVIMSLSLEKRVIPRCLVLNLLASKGLVSRQHTNFLIINDKKFVDKYVTKHVNQIPGILEIYRGKMQLV